MKTFNLRLLDSDMMSNNDHPISLGIFKNHSEIKHAILKYIDEKRYVGKFNVDDKYFKLFVSDKLKIFFNIKTIQ